MLERNWRNNRLFCHIFVIGEVTIRGGACLPPLAYAYAPIEENKKGLRKFYARFLAFSNKISTVQKIVLSSSRGQVNFRGLEASRPRPRTSKCVLEDSTSGKDCLMEKTNASQKWYWLTFNLNESYFTRGKGNAPSSRFLFLFFVINLQKKLFCFNLTYHRSQIYSHIIAKEFEVAGVKESSLLLRCPVLS